VEVEVGGGGCVAIELGGGETAVRGGGEVVGVSRQSWTGCQSCCVWTRLQKPRRGGPRLFGIIHTHPVLRQHLLRTPFDQQPFLNLFTIAVHFPVPLLCVNRDPLVPFFAVWFSNRR